MIAYPPVEWQQEAARLEVALDALKRQARKAAAARDTTTSQLKRDAIEAELRSIGPQIQEVAEELMLLGVEVKL